MKDLIEIISGILVTLFVLAMFFLFEGKPSLWDRLHDKAMQTVSVVPKSN